jgi:hypothetical protein
MAKNLNEPLKSLLNKLSAVRVTLNDDEQSLLDQLIVSSSDEVWAHHKVFVPDEAKAMGLRYTPDGQSSGSR